MKTIILTVKAAKDLDRLPSIARHSISRALVDYAVRGRGDVKKLSGSDGFRLRVGNYRVMFAEDPTSITAI